MHSDPISSNISRLNRDPASNAAERTENLANRVYLDLKREILQCHLAPGDLINESALARQFDVSRTPVREALRRLIQDGYVSLNSGTGYTVSPITIRDVHEVYRLRFILEPEAAELATPRIGLERIETLERLLDELRSLDLSEADDGFRLHYLEANNSFHTAIAKSSGNQRLAHMIARLMEEASRYVFLASISVGARGIDESTRVLKAMKERQPEAARAAMERHIRATHQRAVEAIFSGSFEGVTIGAQGVSI